ncbi:hypothetical protein FOL47_001139 [Perkinsus chesapeaki]|uniref:B box-type domain-containing protein n=1 Tax=Perkinsus chesapeaki TaxID=330153 RepID=A0A7J6KUB7_PERCH|nr:hypothetical protein FOL47_001139 [Perkinsus chesapeaki]
MAEDKMLGQVSTILGESLNRAHREVPPATPEIVESLCILLNIDSVVDYHLAGSVKHALDEFVERQYALTSLVDCPCSPVEFVRLIRREQIRREVTEKHEDVVMCQECEDLAATLKCDPCKDFFCRECFGKTHATGKRKKHITIELDQRICGECRKRVADSLVAAGTPEERYFCDGCYTVSLGENPELKKLPKKILKGFKCFECDLSDRQRVVRGAISMGDNGKKATIICEDCLDMFCPEVRSILILHSALSNPTEALRTLKKKDKKDKKEKQPSEGVEDDTAPQYGRRYRGMFDDPPKSPNVPIPEADVSLSDDDDKGNKEAASGK